MIVYKFPERLWGLFNLKKFIYLILMQVILMNISSLSVCATTSTATTSTVTGTDAATAAAGGVTRTPQPPVTKNVNPLTIKPKKVPEMVIPFEDEDDEYAEEDEDDYYDITKNKTGKYFSHMYILFT